MDYMGVVRRRLWLVALVILLAGIAADTVGRPAGPSAATYSGSSLLSLRAGSKPTDVSYYDFVAKGTSAIIDSASAKLDQAGAGQETGFIQKHVKTTPNPEVGVLRIDVSAQPSGAAAQQVLEAYGGALIDFAANAKTVDRDAALKTADDRIASLEVQISALQDQMKAKGATGTSAGAGSTNTTGSPSSGERLLEAQLTTLLTAHSSAVAEAEQLRTESPDSLSPLGAIGGPLVVADAQSKDPLGFKGRILVGLLIGLVLGVGLVLGLHRFDRRVYTRRDAETAFQLPVLAEIPIIPYSKRRGFQLVAQKEPTAPASEGYRILRSSIDHARARQLHGEGKQAGRGTVVLVTSASRRVGTSTTVANLAVASVYAGKKVLVVGADLRRPSIHQFFRVESGPGLVDFVDDRWRRSTPVDFSAYVQNTVVPDVSIVHHGREVISAGETVAAAGPLLEAARSRYDIIFIDSPSMRAGSDVNELVRFADLVLLTTRVGKSTSDEGEMVFEETERLQAPMCGLVLVGTRSSARQSWLVRLLQGGLARGASRTGRSAHQPTTSRLEPAEPEAGPARPAPRSDMPSVPAPSPIDAVAGGPMAATTMALPKISGISGIADIDGDNVSANGSDDSAAGEGRPSTAPPVQPTRAASPAPEAGDAVAPPATVAMSTGGTPPAGVVSQPPAFQDAERASNEEASAARPDDLPAAGGQHALAHSPETDPNLAFGFDLFDEDEVDLRK